MKYVPRILAKQVVSAAKGFPAVLLTGPRQSGKTTLLKQLFPKAQYVLLEDPDIISRVKSDPHAFLSALKLPVILDEIQNTPELLSYIRTLIDGNPKRKGRWILTGSQEAPLMQGVSESMAGRAAILQLYPLATTESSKVSLLRGGYPDVLAQRRVV
jgi:predicted AAA+ superfamily ATPase